MSTEEFLQVVKVFGEMGKNLEDKIETFESGAIRDTHVGKMRYDLIPLEALDAYAEVLAIGAEKYSERNWEKGMPVSRMYASTLRHLFAWLRGDKSENHLGAVLFNVGAIIAFEKRVADGKLNEDVLDMEIYKKDIAWEKGFK